MTVSEPATTPFDLPDTDLAVSALALVTEVSAEFVVNHCVRSYLFGRELAAVSELCAGTDYDDELLFVACILHDLGVTEHANGDQRFEVDGADAAADFLRQHDVDETRVQRVWNAIALHTSVGLAHRFGPLEGLAQRGIAADVVGEGRMLLRSGFADRVHARWPRRHLGYALGAAIARQVHDNPVKGAPLTFPAQLHQRFYPDAPTVDWFDLVDAAGWDDMPRGAR